MMGSAHRYATGLVAAGLLAAALVGPAGAQDAELTPVDLQLQWFAQAQFGGFYAAKDLGTYEKHGLDVTIRETPSDQAPHVLGSQPDGPEFTISWVPKVLQINETGENDQLVHLAQHFQRSGTLEVSWAPGKGPDPVSEDLIDEPADWAGKTVGMWKFGNEHEILAAANAAGLELGEDYQQFLQDFDMLALLNRQIDASSAMIYNEYAQILEVIDPKTGELYQPEDLTVIDTNEVGSAMLQDAIWARAPWLAEEGNADIATRFLAASFEGWIYCRDNPESCVEIVTANGSILGVPHQRWMMNEINPLIWPVPNGIGSLDPEKLAQTVAVAKDTDIITADPPAETFRSDLGDAARAMLVEAGLDITGADYEKGVVEIVEGGQ
jgi:NitT/TauT family transport system substrate-binding protein